MTHASGLHLVSPDGSPITDSQAAKARRYLQDGGIRLTSSTDDARGWGLPYSTVDVYQLAPIPGCHQVRRVTVTTHFDAAGQVRGRSYRCDCQKARGTATTQSGTCSHTLAVHAYRQLSSLPTSAPSTTA